jgi:His-Xaa-Ser system protein HxsD
MSPEKPHLDLSWVERGEDCLTLTLSTAMYPREALLRACYIFTDRCYLFLQPHGTDQVCVRFRKRRQSADMDKIAGDFSNELLNQALRYSIASETRTVRELIVTQAFAEADFRER